MTVTVDGTLGVSLAAANSVPLGAVQSAAIVASSLSGAQTGSAPIYGCRAWCNFDGTLTGTNAPRAGGNVTSVTRNAVGDYTINFTVAIQDSSFSAVGSSGDTTLTGNQGRIVEFQASSASSVRCIAYGGSFTKTDFTSNNVAIFR